ncbi:MAG: hypothetical protein KC496_15295, partial [Anaerolineae bacterium]|nr:hypothetical protein [Anaerolineae bacterium]
AWQHGETYRLRVTANGTNIHATISDGTNTEHLQWTDEAAYMHGQIGLCSWYGSHTRFTSVRVQPVSED